MKSHSNNHPDNIYNLMIAALEEIVGETSLRKAMQSAQGGNRSSTAENRLAALQAALETFYGRQGGRGLALQAGRCAFNTLLRCYGAEMGLLDNAYRMLTTPRRIPAGLAMIAQKLYDLGAPLARISGTESAWLWENPQCIFNGVWESEKPGCTFLIGILQEYLSWTSGGRYYPLRETDCVRCGDECCIIRIKKIPLD